MWRRRIPWGHTARAPHGVGAAESQHQRGPAAAMGPSDDPWVHTAWPTTTKESTHAMGSRKAVASAHLVEHSQPLRAPHDVSHAQGSAELRAPHDINQAKGSAEALGSAHATASGQATGSAGRSGIVSSSGSGVDVWPMSPTLRTVGRATPAHAAHAYPCSRSLATHATPCHSSKGFHGNAGMHQAVPLYKHGASLPGACSTPNSCRESRSKAMRASFHVPLLGRVRRALQFDGKRLDGSVRHARPEP